MATEKKQKDISNLPDEELTPEQLAQRQKNRKKREAQRAKKKNAQSDKAQNINVKKTTPTQKPVSVVQQKKSPAIKAVETLHQYFEESEGNTNLKVNARNLFRNRAGVVRAIVGAMQYEPDSFINIVSSKFSCVGDTVRNLSTIDSVLDNIQYQLINTYQRSDVTDKDTKVKIQKLSKLQEEYLTVVENFLKSTEELIERAFKDDVATRRMQEQKEKEEERAEKLKAEDEKSKAASVTTASTPTKEADKKSA